MQATLKTSRFRWTISVAGPLILTLVGCANAPESDSGSLQAIKRAQFMPVYEQCLRTHAPLRPGRTGMKLYNVGKECMLRANAVVR